MIGSWLARPTPPRKTARRHLIPPWLARLFIRRYVSHLPAPVPVADGSPIEVFLRLGPRDFSIAPLASASLQQHLVNRLSSIVVATPRTSVAQARRLFAGIDVVADEQFLSADRRAAIEGAVRADRRGWVTQQFLSLAYVSIRARAPCLVWDADTVMIRPQTLLLGRVAQLAISMEHHQPYFDLIHALLPDLLLPLYSSAVAHHMVMDPDLLRELLLEIQQRSAGLPWRRAILGRIDRDGASPMADYELYGQWVRTRHPDRVLLVAFRNLALSRRRVLSQTVQQWTGRRRAHSISAHWRLPEVDA